MKIKMLVVGGLVAGALCLAAHAAESDWEQNPLDHGQPITASVDFTVKGTPWRAGDFRTKEGAWLRTAIPGWREIPWETIGLFHDKWRKEIK